MSFDDFLNSKYPNFKYIYDCERYPSTRIVKSRERKPYESDEDYIKYLEEFYKKKDSKNKK